MLTFIGDVVLPHPCNGGEILPGDLVVNLEAPITSNTIGWPDTVNLRTVRNHLCDTFGRPPIAACLGNNHVMDFGEIGLRDTMASLDAIGTVHFGAGARDTTIRFYRSLIHDDIKLGLLSFVCPTAHPVFASDQHSGVSQLNEHAIREAAALARAEGCERIVLNLHWGVEDVSLPRPQDVALARGLAMDGVFDLMIGHHAHCIQGWEVVNGRHLFFGLGNAIFPDIDVPCNFDNDGLPHGRYIKQQQYWNARSLAVLFSPKDLGVQCWTISSNGDRLNIVARTADRYRLRIRVFDSYERRFARRYMRDTWRKKLVNYARNPVLPRTRHIRSMYRIARESLGR